MRREREGDLTGRERGIKEGGGERKGKEGDLTGSEGEVKEGRREEVKEEEGVRKELGK